MIPNYETSTHTPILVVRTSHSNNISVFQWKIPSIYSLISVMRINFFRTTHSTWQLSLWNSAPYHHCRFSAIFSGSTTFKHSSANSKKSGSFIAFSMDFDGFSVLFKLERNALKCGFSNKRKSLWLSVIRSRNSCGTRSSDSMPSVTDNFPFCWSIQLLGYPLILVLEWYELGIICRPYTVSSGHDLNPYSNDYRHTPEYYEVM